MNKVKNSNKIEMSNNNNTNNNYFNNSFDDKYCKNYNYCTINSDSLVHETQTNIINSEPLKDNLKKCNYCYLEFEHHEFFNHILIHESQFTNYRNSEQCNCNSKSEIYSDFNKDNCDFAAPNSFVNNELPSLEDIIDAADKFEIIDKKEVEKQIEEEKLKSSKKTISGSKSQIKVNTSQVRSIYQGEPKKKIPKTKKSTGTEVFQFALVLLRFAFGILAAR